MGWAPLPGFIGDSYSARSINADAQRCLNMYLEVLESSKAKNSFALYGTPGLRTFGTLPTAPVRGLWAGDNRLFAVGGNVLYEMKPNGTVKSVRGNLGGGSGPVRLFANGTVLFGVDAGFTFYDTGTQILQVQDDQGAPIVASMGAYSDGFFIAQIKDSNQLNISPALDNTGVWDTLQFFTKSGAPDRLLATINDHEELYLFGYGTAEVWRLTGNGLNGFPYEKDPSATMILGISAPFSATSLDVGVAWLVEDDKGWAMAQLASGYTPSRISTHAIETAWSKYPTIQDAESYAYRDEGHQLWQITFPSAPNGGATWVYDATTSLMVGRAVWHERTAAGGTAGRCRQSCHAFAFQKHIVGDYSTGMLYQQSLDFYDENGAAITRIRRCPHLSNMRVNTFGHTIVLEYESGGVAVNPLLSWANSADASGNLLFNTPRAGQIGRASVTQNAESKWDQLGYWKDRVWQLTINDKAKVALVNAYLLSTPGF